MQRVRIVDDDSEYFNELGYIQRIDEYQNGLKMYIIKIDSDGDPAGFLAYQFIGVIEDDES